LRVISCGFESHPGHDFMLQKKRNKIIISADDFGKSELANKNILKLAEAGKLDRVSVMANGNFSSEEISRIKKTGVKLDIHLDLADVPKKERKLKKGVLARGIVFFLKHIASPSYRKESIRKKWDDQIERFRELFKKIPDGINSHQHVHLFGRYFQVAIDLARKDKISYFRFAKKGLLGTKTNIRKVVYVIWKKERKKHTRLDFERPDYFASLDWIGDLDKFVKDFPEGKTELACHPERIDEYNIIEDYF
jgi:predicted glycoside hydrolase/deacetylase ChbG (UPF0249 family)